MLKEKRIQKIEELLKSSGYVETSQLSRAFNVTEMTIRRDLDALINGSSKIVRTHGGAMLVSSGDQSESPYEYRITENDKLKIAIAKKARSFIHHGEILFIDSGTTTYHLARQLDNEVSNTVITNGINIASELLSRDWINVVLIGGELKQNTHSTRGALAEEQIRNFRMNVAFLGANAIGSDGNIYLANTHEIGIKKAALSSSEKKYILVDSNKFDHFNLVAYAHAKDITGIITDYMIPQSTVQRLTDMGIHMIIAEKED